MWSIGSASAALARQLRWLPTEEIANDEGMSRNHPDVGVFYDATWEPTDAEVGQTGGLRSPMLPPRKPPRGLLRPACSMSCSTKFGGSRLLAGRSSAKGRNGEGGAFRRG